MSITHNIFLWKRDIFSWSPGSRTISRPLGAFSTPWPPTTSIRPRNFPCLRGNCHWSVSTNGRRRLKWLICSWWIPVIRNQLLSKPNPRPVLFPDFLISSGSFKGRKGTRRLQKICRRGF
jgi:hypothetical protein